MAPCPPAATPTTSRPPPICCPTSNRPACSTPSTSKRRWTTTPTPPPARPSSRPSSTRLDPVKTVKDDYGPTNYLFNAGSKPDLADNDGIFYLDSKVKLTDITDGTSNTLFTGETLKGDGGTKAEDVRRQYVLLKKDALKGIKDDAGVQDFKDDKNIAGDRCASWMDGRFLQGTFTGTLGLNDAKPDVSCGGAGGLSGLRTFGEGANVGFADGSVRFINQSVKPAVWKLLTGRNDGEPLPPDF